jgi:hypothetical protein
MTQTSLTEALRINRREIRARELTAHVLHVLREFIQEDSVHGAHNALLKLFLQQGVEVLTDEDRRLVGLEPRGGDGWTPSELLALERVRLEVMLKPLSVAAHPAPPSVQPDGPMYPPNSPRLGQRG